MDHPAPPRLRAEHRQGPGLPRHDPSAPRGLLHPRPGFGGGKRQTADFIKVCSPDAKELNEWAVTNLGYGLRGQRCQHCDPTSLELTD
jgi:hypothetical protein